MGKTRQDCEIHPRFSLSQCYTQGFRSLSQCARLCGLNGIIPWLQPIMAWIDQHTLPMAVPVTLIYESAWWVVKVSGIIKRHQNISTNPTKVLAHAGSPWRPPGYTCPLVKLHSWNSGKRSQDLMFVHVNAWWHRALVYVEQAYRKLMV